MIIVAFTGEAGSGKDTCGEVLIKNHGFKKLSFAGPLKQLLSDTFNIPISSFEDRVLKDQLHESLLTLSTDILNILLNNLDKLHKVEYDKKTIIDKFAGTNIKSIRQLMQLVGTEVVRTHISGNYWIDLLQKKIEESDSNVVITDVRLNNEKAMLKKLKALIIRVKRPGYENKSSHASENEFGEDSEYAVVVQNNGCRVALQSEIDLWWTYRKKATR